MQYQICKKDVIRVVGIKTPLTEEHEENMEKIPLFWEQTIGTEQFRQICELAEQEPYGVLGVSAYFDPQHIFYYIAAATDQPVPDGLEELLIPEATWCVASGDPYRPATFEELFRGLYLEFFPSTGMDYAALPDIEVYPLEGTGLGTPIKEAWFAVKRIDDDETPQNVS